MSLRMNSNFENQPSALSSRIESIDVLRGFTILIMLFVNDLASVADVPAWLKHYHSSSADGMTFVDVVFPAFLFIVGMAIPFAVRKRLEKGHSLGQIWKHVFLRSFSLIIIGLFMVNSSYNNSDRGFLNPLYWTLLMYVGIIFIWNSGANRTPSVKKIIAIFKPAGIVMLVVLALIHRGNGDPAFLEFKPFWWGILGLIGWAYLVSSLAYLPLRKSITGLIGVMVILYTLYMADEAAGPFLAWMRPWMKIGLFLCTHSAIIIAGVILGMKLTPESNLKTHIERIKWAFFYGLVFIITGLLVHSLHDFHRIFIISKNLATIPWCLLCSGIMVWLWIIVYWLIDIRAWKKWTSFVAPAGRNPLFAYVLASIVLLIFSLITDVFNISNFYNNLGQSFSIGLIRSIMMSFALVWLTGFLRRIGINLRL